MAIKNLGRVVGLSAYETWLAQGNDGTEEDFLATLKGEKGDKGEIGPQGPQGEQGPEGRGSQADWSQNDENADSYIKNRPFYEGAKVTNIINPAKTCTFTYYQDNDAFADYKYTYTEEEQNVINSLADGSGVIRITINGNTFESKSITISNKKFYSGTVNLGTALDSSADDSNFLFAEISQEKISISNANLDLGSFDFDISLSIVAPGEVVKIDKKYLPDTVVFEDEVAQPDYNQNDSTQPDYIKNRPFYEASTDVTILEKAERTTKMINYDWGQGITIEDDKATIIETDSTKSYKLTIDGKTYTGTMNRNANVETEDYGVIEIAPYWLYFQDYYSDPITVTIEFIVSAPGEIVKIDEKYLPDSVLLVRETTELGDVYIINNSEKTFELDGGDVGGYWGTLTSDEQDAIKKASEKSVSELKIVFDGVEGTMVYNPSYGNWSCEINGTSIDLSEYYDFVIVPAEYGDETVTHTISISYQDEVTKIEPIPEKYLPDTIATKEYVDEKFNSIVNGDEVSY